MFGISIIKTKELQRLRQTDRIFTSIIRSKNESINSLQIRIEQLKVHLKNKTSNTQLS